jgi:hypothetical protein
VGRFGKGILSPCTRLALKIELAVDEEVATLAGGERCLAVPKGDGWRLADPAPAGGARGE